MPTSDDHCHLTYAGTKNGAHHGGSVFIMADGDTLIAYIKPFNQPDTTHIITAARASASVTLQLLDRMGFTLRSHRPIAGDHP